MLNFPSTAMSSSHLLQQSHRHYKRGETTKHNEEILRTSLLNTEETTLV